MPALQFGKDRTECISAEHRKPSQAGPHCIRCCTKTKRNSFHLKDVVIICKIRAKKMVIEMVNYTETKTTLSSLRHTGLDERPI